MKNRWKMKKRLSDFFAHYNKQYGPEPLDHISSVLQKETPGAIDENSNEICRCRMAEIEGWEKEVYQRQKKKMKKNVTFDELEGGAIRTDTRRFESAAPPREDFTTVMRGAEISQFEGDSGSYYTTALDMIPRNLYPMFQYETLFQGNNPSLMKNSLVKGLSGYGAHRDPPHVQKATVHSLKAYPKLLHAYLNSRNLILSS